MKDAQTHALIYPGFISEKREFTSIFVAHNRFISVYDMISQSWIQHSTFEEGDVHDIFRIQSSGKAAPAEGGEGEEGEEGASEEESTLNIGVLLKNGGIYSFKPKELPSTATASDIKFKIDGEVEKGYADLDRQNFYMLLHSSDDEKYSVSVVQANHKIVDLTSSLPDLDENTNFVIAQFQEKSGDEAEASSSKINSYIVLQQLKNIKVYLLSNNNGQDEEVSIKLTHDLGDIADIDPDNVIHSAIFPTMDHVVLLDEVNMHVMEIKTKKVTTHAEIYCRSFNQFEKPYAYALCEENTTSDQKEGLRIYNIDDVIENKRAIAIQLADCDVGVSANVIFDHFIERVIYLESLNNLRVIPNVYHNAIKFIGISKESDYLCFKVI
jgi:hypothetical protein